MQVTVMRNYEKTREAFAAAQGSEVVMSWALEADLGGNPDFTISWLEYRAGDRTSMNLCVLVCKMGIAKLANLTARELTE